MGGSNNFKGGNGQAIVLYHLWKGGDFSIEYLFSFVVVSSSEWLALFHCA
jgi:hypothetical protein